MKEKESAYKQAGVDIEAGNALVERIKEPVKATHRSGVMAGLGGFGALFDLKETGYKDPLLVSATDGVGTKLRVAIEAGVFDTVGIDLVAMCVNDLVTLGAEPLFFLDYFACGKLDVDHAAQVITGIAAGCEKAGCALIGGETAEMPGMYQNDDFDLAGFSVGAVERDKVLRSDDIKVGDVIIGLPSSGVHSNGYSLVRKIVSESGLSYQDAAPFAPELPLGQALLTPTEIYIKDLLVVMDDVKGLAHITGGGLLENIPRVLPSSLTAHLDARNWDFLPIFSWLKQQADMTNVDMALTFNCGIGMAVICAPEKEDELLDGLVNASVIGRIEARSQNNGQPIIIDNMDTAWV